MTRVTVWNEYRQERSDPPVRAVYPDGIHVAIRDGLRDAGFASGSRPWTNRTTG